MRSIVLAAVCLGSLCAYGGESSFPWEELRELYREKVVRELEESGAVAEGPPLATLDEAAYVVHLYPDRAEGTVVIMGAQLRGTPAPVPLFGPEIVLSETREIAGANLLPRDSGGGIDLLPVAGAPGFQLTADFVAPVRAERGHQVLTLSIPTAVKNRLRVELEDGLRLLEAPGIPGADGSYHLGATGTLTVRYLHESEPGESGAVEPDLSALTAMEQRSAVLESQTLRVSFDETGRSLSTLQMTLPPEGESRLVVTPAPDSEIWSLTVNGEPKQVYLDESGHWIVPLERGRESEVELAFLREGAPVGLLGRLEVAVPATGLAADTLYVGVELPGRVELVSVEGPVNTRGSAEAERPPGLSGPFYVFTQPFYKGEGISVAISYKEPVNNRS